VPRGWRIDEYKEQHIRRIICWIESDTLLRTNEELLREVMTELGFKRQGKRITDAISAAIAAERRGF
jgi:hypothetical protein